MKNENFPKLSNRSSALGTENAFVVLAEVTALQCAGRDIISFCIGQPDFPTPVNIQDAAVKAIRERPGHRILNQQYCWSIRYCVLYSKRSYMDHPNSYNV